MSFQGINFSSQHIVPSDDGRLYEAIFEDGALHGCELSYVGEALTIGAGYLMIGGREIEITEDEVFNINEATSGYAQLVLTIDLTQTATIGAFNQVSIDVRYASTEAGFASLIQDDINGAGTKYQQQLALVSLGTGGITGIVAGIPSASLKGAGRVFSIISVTYPEGSVCTCSDGTTTLTARDTSGKALFNVTVGEWTVSCADGSQMVSRSFAITAAGQVELVTLSYIPYLYINGNECVHLTGGWVSEAKGINSGGPSGLAPTVARGNTLEISLTGNVVGGIVRTNNKIDLTKYSSIKFNGEMVNPTDNYQGWLQICVWSNIGTYYMDNIVANYIVSRYTTINSAAIDISSLSGSFYVGFGLFSAGQTMSISVDSLLLE